MRFVAGQGAVAKLLVRGAAVAERHRENVAGRGAVAERLCGRGCRSAEADVAPTEELAAATAKHGVAPSGSTCEQGEAMRAGRSSAGREEQCWLLVDEDGEVVPSEYLLRHTLELCGSETLYFGTGGLHWLYVAEDHH